jgi:hypothetical protein
MHSFGPGGTGGGGTGGGDGGTGGGDGGDDEDRGTPSVNLTPAEAQRVVTDPGGRNRDVIFFQRNYPHLCNPALAAAKLALLPGQNWNMKRHNETIKALLHAQGPNFYEQMMSDWELIHVQNQDQYNCDLASARADDPTPEQWAQ